MGLRGLGPVAEHLDEFGDAGALAIADVVAAGGDAQQDAAFVVEAEKFAEAKAGVEMVARAGGDDGLCDEGAVHEGDGPF